MSSFRGRSIRTRERDLRSSTLAGGAKSFGKELGLLFKLALETGNLLLKHVNDL